MHSLRIHRGSGGAAGTVLVVIALAACAPRGPVVVEARPDSSVARPTPPTPGGDAALATREARWSVVSREHVDLWLHGFAMLQADSTLVPYFRRDYRSHLQTVRHDRGVTTSLDANQTRLSSYLDKNPGLVSAQFLALYFGSWEELRQGFDLFMRTEGNPRGAHDDISARIIATFAASFPQSADRDWARLFIQSLEDERTRFFHDWWTTETRTREPARTTFEAAWRDRYLARFSAYLNNSRQRAGDILLSVALGGEGRTIAGGPSENSVAVAFPDDTAGALQPIFVFAHEVVGSIANAAVEDGTTPAEKRDGTAGRYNSLAAVRGGALLVARVAPELVEPYQRFYLSVAGRPVPAANVEAAFNTTFPIPDAIRTALTRQLDVVLGGI